VITTPSGGQKLLGKGFYNITGLAWSGRGKITGVDVSTDGGKNWKTARLQGPINDKSLTRFNLPWVWDGKSDVLLQSRAVDSTGYVQPSYRALREVRGKKSIYHNNAIQSWRVDAAGEVHNVHLG
jgi:sulfane dehydrogenase subunit SoxC